MLWAKNSLLSMPLRRFNSHRIMGAAKAAELEVPAYRRAHRYVHRRHHRVALYDPFCGGPYVGGGWNGGIYWGGPWMDLRCYGYD
jgi:hypothetical protein